MDLLTFYTKYKIMPQLQTHMLRVAGVGSLILDGWQVPVDRDLVMRTLLLHDMGNIVKFDLQNPLMPIRDLDKWMKIQAQFWTKYGRDAHAATQQILAEAGQNEVIEVLEQERAGYESGDTALLLEQDWPAKILAYCDVRVTPAGVASLKERIHDLHLRYGRPESWSRSNYDADSFLI
jgi:hypothetical protein